MSNNFEDQIRSVLTEDAQDAPTGNDLAGRARQRVRRHRQKQVAWCGAAALAISLGTVTLTGLTGSDTGTLRAGEGSSVPADGPDTSASQRPEVARQGALPLPTSGSATCAIYSPENAFSMSGVIAFDGTVTQIETPPGDVDFVLVTFTVESWYEGGSGDSMVVRFPTGFDVDPGPPAIEVGTRLLVNGYRTNPDSAAGPVMAAGCGFTRYWDERTAAAWERASA